MEERTVGCKQLVHGTDRTLIERGVDYIKSKGMGVGGNLVDVGAGYGSRCEYLCKFCDSYYSFDSDLRMVNKFNSEILGHMNRHPLVLFAPMIHA